MYRRKNITCESDLMIMSYFQENTPHVEYIHNPPQFIDRTHKYKSLKPQRFQLTRCVAIRISTKCFTDL